MRRLISRLGPVALVILVVLACANSGNLNSRRNENRTGTTANKLQPVTGRTPKRVRWGYSEFDDEMGRGRVFHTSIESSNTISLGFPYEGEQHGTLALREHPEHGKDVYIRIEKGQLLDSDYHGRVMVRFDNDKPRAFRSVRPSDLSSDVVFNGRRIPCFPGPTQDSKDRQN